MAGLVMVNLKKIREERGVSRKALAEAVNVDYSTVFKWEERGQGTDYLEEVADFLHCPTDELLGRPPLNPTLPVRQENPPCLTGQTAP